MPMICRDPHRQCQDILMHILYNGSSEPLLRSLIIKSMQNISEEFPTQGVRNALSHYIIPKEGVSLASLRAIFFVLLNQDSRMRSEICTTRLVPYIPELCPYKACSLYDQVREVVIMDWVKDETITVLQFVERLKDSYLVA